MILFPKSLGKLKFLPLFILAVLLLGGSAVVWYYWQDNQINELRNEVSAGKSEDAAKRAESLENLSLPNREVQRLKALNLRQKDPQQALQMLDSLVMDSTAADYQENVLAYLSIAIESQSYDSAYKALKAHYKRMSYEPAYLYWQARYLYEMNETAECLMVLDRLLSIDSEYTKALLLRAKILLSLNEFVNAVQAKVNLRLAAKNFGPDGKEALILLATVPEIPIFPNDRAWLVRALQNQALNDPEIGLLAATQELILKPDEKDRIIEATIRNYGKSSALLVTSWLQNLHAIPELKQFLKSHDAKSLDASDLLKLKVEIALNDGNYNEAEKLLSEAGPAMDGINELQRATMLALIEYNQQIETPMRPTEKWLTAQHMAIAAHDAGILNFLAQIAAKSKWLAESIECYDAALQATDFPLVRAQLLLDKFNVALQLGNTTEALNVAQSFLKIYPEHSVMLNNAYYLEALLDSPNFAPMEYPSDQLNTDLDGFIWSTYALSMWRAGKIQAAQDALNKLPQKYLQLPSCQLVEILIALDTNRLDEARALSESIPMDALLPEERALLIAARQKLRS